MRLNLLSKILMWVFINILVLGVVSYFVFDLQFNFSPGSPMLGAINERIDIIAEMIVTESAEKSKSERDEILQKYSDNYGIEFTLFSNDGEQLGGKPLELPTRIKESLARPFIPPPGFPVNSNFPPPPRKVSIDRTSSPTRYWAIARVPIAEKGGVSLRITDSGDGVPETEIAQIFDPLYRVEKDRARQTGGSGLGLAIVKTCIEACGGRVYAENLKPHGFAIVMVLKPANPNFPQAG